MQRLKACLCRFEKLRRIFELGCESLSMHSAFRHSHVSSSARVRTKLADGLLPRLQREVLYEDRLHRYRVLALTLSKVYAVLGSKVSRVECVTLGVALHAMNLDASL